MTGPNPTDRAKSGTKRHLLVDARGVPLAIVVSGANTHDKVMLEELLGSLVVRRPDPAAAAQNLCADKGYDYPDTRAAVVDMGYEPHIRARGEEKAARRKGHRARRWVVEACHSWLNRFRKILVRFEKKACNALGLLMFASAIIAWRQTGILG